MIHPDHLRELIEEVLKQHGLYSKAAVELLMLTAAQESHCGRYLRQIKGPALGIFQMEPATYHDLWKNYIFYNYRIAEELNKYNVNSNNWRIHMIGNIPYQILIARVNYLRMPELLPDHNDLRGLARYYKKYWNTYLGAATIDEAMNNYYLYAVSNSKY